MASDPRSRLLKAGLLLAAGCLPAGCASRQSALHPAGEEAADVATLFWAMTAGGAGVWLVVMGIAIYAVLGKNRPKSERFADAFVLWGGVVFPTVVLAALLVFGLALLPGWSADEPADLRVHVRAEQYWWRIGYELPGGVRVETANAVHLPAGRTAEFVVTSPDVIHSFWIPSLGGKIDAIPGRTNLLRLTPTRPGRYRGVCAEFCGPSHALMAFEVEVHEAASYADWLMREAAPAAVAPGSPGAMAFAAAGCGGCHTVRGISEAGAVGPDLTHFASRHTLGAATRPNIRAQVLTWLEGPGVVKPGVHMPGFAMLPLEEREAIADFLMELK